MIDLSRPPEPPPGSWSFPGRAWVVLLFGVLAVGLVAVLFTPWVAPFRGNWALVFVLAFALLAVVFAARIGMQLKLKQDVADRKILTVDNPDEEGPRTDRMERDAWRKFRRGELGRYQFERIRARRKLARGEWTEEEYHQALRELDQAEANLSGGPNRAQS